MKKILVVERRAITRKMIQEAVEKEGYSYLEADNGALARTLYIKEQPDLVIVAAIMPLMDGAETIKNILAYDTQAQCITYGPKDDEICAQALREGAKLHLDTPLGYQSLQEAFHQILE